VAAVVLVLLAGAVLRFLAVSDLWLDEGQSVAIARLPVPELFDALRQDGSPPLYYLLLHVWMSWFGTGDLAVRSLSGVVGLVTLPLAWWLTRALAGRRVAAATLLLLAASPFATRYATETRMYALLLLLAVLGGLAARWALRRPGPWPVAAVAAVTSALVYTHYWAVYFVAAAGLITLGAAVRVRPAAWRVVAGFAIGGLTLLPWLPSLLQQLRHTGTPWANSAPGAVPTLALEAWTGGQGNPGRMLALFLVVLAVVGACAAGLRRGPRTALLLSRPRGRRLLLVGLSAGTLLVAAVVTALTHSAVSGRYTSVAFLPFLVLAGYGLAALPGRGTRAVVALLVLGLGFGIAVPQALRQRTQAGQVAKVLELASPGDLIVFCPDQLGVSVSRVAPDGLDLRTFPALRPAGRVDWTDYAERNDAVSPESFSDAVLARSGGAAIWLVTGVGYRVPSDVTCDTVSRHLAQARGFAELRVPPNSHVFEEQRLERFPAEQG
jgi:uncharacterized membrane protein